VYSRGYKKRAIAEKMFETLAILAVVYTDVFRFFFFLSGPEKTIFACGRIYFYTNHTVATIKSHEVTPFLRLDFFLQDAWSK
jgi:hypothetical protein